MDKQPALDADLVLMIVSHFDRLDAADVEATVRSAEELAGCPIGVRWSDGAEPVTGSNKVLKRELQEQRWHTDEPVFWWAGRGAPEFLRMTSEDKTALDAQFMAYGRQRLL